MSAKSQPQQPKQAGKMREDEVSAFIAIGMMVMAVVGRLFAGPKGFRTMTRRTINGMGIGTGFGFCFGLACEIVNGQPDDYEIIFGLGTACGVGLGGLTYLVHLLVKPLRK